MKLAFFAFMLMSHSLIIQAQNSRKLLLFARSADDSQLKEQLNILQTDPGGLTERNLSFKVVTPILDNKLYYEVMKDKKNFLLLLFGKDGGLKFKSAKPISIQKLYEIVDSMPMRKEEIKQKNSVGIQSGEIN